MSIDIPQKDDQIFIKLVGAASGDYCSVIDWGADGWNQKWAILNVNGTKCQINISQIAHFNIIKRGDSKQYTINKSAKHDNPALARATKQAIATVTKMEKRVEPDPDPTPELQGVTDPTLRALKLVDLRKTQQKIKAEQIRDHMTDSELKPVKHHYEMPSFKKRT